MDHALVTEGAIKLKSNKMNILFKSACYEYNVILLKWGLPDRKKKSSLRTILSNKISPHFVIIIIIIIIILSVDFQIQLPLKKIVSMIRKYHNH